MNYYFSLNPETRGLYLAARIKMPSPEHEKSFRKKLVKEMRLIQRELKLSDVDMCNFMCISMTGFNQIMREELTPAIFNLIMFIASTRRPLYTLVQKLGPSEYQRGLHFLLLRSGLRQHS